MVAHSRFVFTALAPFLFGAFAVVNASTETPSYQADDSSLQKSKDITQGDFNEKNEFPAVNEEPEVPAEIPQLPDERQPPPPRSGLSAFAASIRKAVNSIKTKLQEAIPYGAFGGKRFRASHQPNTVVDTCTDEELPKAVASRLVNGVGSFVIESPEMNIKVEAQNQYNDAYRSAIKSLTTEEVNNLKNEMSASIRAEIDFVRTHAPSNEKKIIHVWVGPPGARIRVELEALPKNKSK